MTGQDLLDRMELLNAELQLQPGEPNVTKGLLALNVAQDFFEGEAAKRPRIFGSSVGTVATAASTETTAFPAGVLRIDRLQLLGSDNLPQWDLVPSKRAGGHRPGAYWPLNMFITSTAGKPSRYWTNGRNIYWDPLPSGTHTVRWYGFERAANITAGGTFAYDDLVALPLAALAARLLKTGLDDEVQDLAGVVSESFTAVLDSLSRFQRDGALGFDYTEIHRS